MAVSKACSRTSGLSFKSSAALEPRQPARAQERKLHGVTAVFVGDATKRCVVAKHGNLEKAGKLQVLAQLNEPRSV